MTRWKGPLHIHIAPAAFTSHNPTSRESGAGPIRTNAQAIDPEVGGEGADITVILFVPVCYIQVYKISSSFLFTSSDPPAPINVRCPRNTKMAAIQTAWGGRGSCLSSGSIPCPQRQKLLSGCYEHSTQKLTLHLSDLTYKSVQRHTTSPSHSTSVPTHTHWAAVGGERTVTIEWGGGGKVSS